MELFLKCSALALTVVIIYPVVAHKDKAFASLASIAVCCVIMLLAAEYLEPVLDFFTGLQEQTGIDRKLFAILLKIVGLGLIAEIAVLVCSDSGNGAMAKAITTMASVTVLWISIPLLEGFLDLIGELLSLL